MPKAQGIECVCVGGANAVWVAFALYPFLPTGFNYRRQEEKDRYTSNTAL